MTISHDMEQKVYKYGTYYNPASKHYSHWEDINVVCDRCDRSNLNVCIGYKDCDLCLKCVDAISSYNPIFKKETRFPELVPVSIPFLFSDKKETPYPKRI